MRRKRENTELPPGSREKAADLWSKANPHPDPNHAYLAREGACRRWGFARLVTPWWFPSWPTRR